MKKASCIAFGMFDGVHMGHQAIIESLCAEARNNGLAPVIVKLMCTPESENCHKQLTTDDEAAPLLRRQGLEVIPIPINGAVSQMSAEQFVKEVLVDRYNAKMIVAGSNIRFGKGKLGGVGSLRTLAYKYDYRTVIVDALTEGDDPFSETVISSPLIRDVLTEKDVQRANRLLTRPYALSGLVVGGRGLGRLANMPTANLLTLPNKFIPAYGVYATTTNVHGVDYPGLTHVGFKPTVDMPGNMTIEIHLLDFAGDLYNQQLKTELHMYIRETRKFKNLDEVRAQIDRDEVVAREFFARQGNSLRT